jgi:large subunit ribosomal protein L28
VAKCPITGKAALNGNRVSHSNIKTKHRQLASAMSKRVWDDAQKRWVRLKISARGLRFLNRMPLSELRRKYGL